MQILKYNVLLPSFVFLSLLSSQLPHFDLRHNAFSLSSSSSSAVQNRIYSLIANVRRAMHLCTKTKWVNRIFAQTLNLNRFVCMIKVVWPWSYCIHIIYPGRERYVRIWAKCVARNNGIWFSIEMNGKYRKHISNDKIYQVSGRCRRAMRRLNFCISQVVTVCSCEAGHSRKYNYMDIWFAIRIFLLHISVPRCCFITTLLPAPESIRF